MASKGRYSGRAFAIDSRFDDRGGLLGGLRAEIYKDGRPGKPHTPLRGSVLWTATRWTNPAKVMMISIDLDFAGTQDGRRMTGTVTAEGRESMFTAKRL